jgi:shikimate dehydrogenase
VLIGARLRGRRCAVLGSPVGHSLSPALHRAAYRELGLDWRYDAVEVTADGLAGFLAGLGRQWRGVSLTMPLKRAVMGLLDDASPLALTADAANTVLIDDHGRRSGHNTDVAGIELALREHGVDHVRTATVLGGGATATSAVLALHRLGCSQVTLLVREPARAREVLEASARVPTGPTVRVAPLAAVGPGHEPPGCDVVVSTVPASAQEPLVDPLVTAAEVVFDVLYDPWPTPLVSAASAAGRTVLGGLDLLLHQAARQVELMTGCPQAPLEAMRAAGTAALRQP